eukprot:TRINITY_DN71304_c0_g1_i1.p1 TRINITY_DN71304_c0_g1~~TRINITY_DN71304_c0_g1_i1.p1  ORF type:complete len:496 (-),score=117.63 TRINITY_DN71304_c0_g1_i1:36-1523(-)
MEGSDAARASSSSSSAAPSAVAENRPRLRSLQRDVGRDGGCMAGLLGCICDIVPCSGRIGGVTKQRSRGAASGETAAVAGASTSWEVAARASARRRPLSLAHRTLEALVLLGPLLAPWFRRRRRISAGDLTSASLAASAAAWERLCSRLALLGPGFAKLGQALQGDAAPAGSGGAAWPRPLPPPSAANVAAARRCVEKALDRHAAEVFLIPPGRENPVKVSPLALIFRWTLCEGPEVAVKVQRPGISESLALDLLAMRTVLRVAEIFVQLLDGFCCAASAESSSSSTTTASAHLQGPASSGGPLRSAPSSLSARFESWAQETWGELDYRREAEDQDRFCRDVLRRLRGVEVPEVYWKASSAQVLTTRWVQGVRLAEVESSSGRGRLRLGLAGGRDASKVPRALTAGTAEAPDFLRSPAAAAAAALAVGRRDCSESAGEGANATTAPAAGSSGDGGASRNLVAGGMVVASSTLPAGALLNLSLQVSLEPPKPTVLI